jgi:hypothetical protein
MKMSGESYSMIVEDPFDVSYLRGDLRKRAAELLEFCRVDGVECDFGKLALVLASRGRLDKRTQAFSEHLHGQERRRLEDVVFAFAYAAARDAIAEEAEIDRLCAADKDAARGPLTSPGHTMQSSSKEFPISEERK